MGAVWVRGEGEEERMNMKKMMVLVLVMIIAGGCLGRWERTYGGIGDDSALWAIRSYPPSTGDIVLAGYTSSFGADSGDIYLLKIDKDGNLIWENNYGGLRRDVAYSIYQCSDSGYIVTGYSRSYSAGDEDVFLLKSNFDGVCEWIRTYENTGDDRGQSVIQLSDGSFSVTGDKNRSSEDAWILRMDSTGDTIFTRTYDWGYHESANCHVITEDGRLAIAGGAYLPSLMADAFFMLTDSLGDSILFKNYGGPSSDNAYNINKVSGGGYIITGYTLSYGVGGYDFYVIRVDSLGDTLWTRTYGGPLNDTGFFGLESINGGFIITGGTYSFGAGSLDVYLVRTDYSGDTLWTRTFGGTGMDCGRAIIEDCSGDIIVIGYTNSFGYGGLDVFVLRTDSNGNLSSIKDFTSLRPSSLFLSTYPNPFNSAVNISVGAIHELPLQIEIFDINGRMVYEMAVGDVRERPDDGRFTNRPYETVWQPDESLPSGVYLARIKETNAATKIIYMK